MQINQWRGGAMRVTEENDDFFDRPLPELTLFRFESHDVQVHPHSGAFSIKFVRSGAERYEFARRRVNITPGDALLINAGETYGSTVATPSESVSLFYCDHEVVDAFHAISDENDNLLDNPNSCSAIEVPQAPMRMPAEISINIDRLIDAADRRDLLCAEEAARNILAGALRHSLALAPPTALRAVTKRATRDELIARVHRAKHYIDDMKGRKCELGALAEIACLSKYHFLRVFREVIGEPPLAYARRKRLEVARHALQFGAAPAEAARRAGYRDMQAFERAYLRAFDRSPRNR